MSSRHARYVNTGIAENRVPANADVAAVKVIVVPETGANVNPLGVKGVGELGDVGAATAIADATPPASEYATCRIQDRQDSYVRALRQTQPFGRWCSVYAIR
jgi:exosome complex RNA-binding protein Csl4